MIRQQIKKLRNEMKIQQSEENSFAAPPPTRRCLRIDDESVAQRAARRVEIVHDAELVEVVQTATHVVGANAAVLRQLRRQRVRQQRSIASDRQRLAAARRRRNRRRCR